MQPESTPQLIMELAAGDEAAAEKLLPLIYDELRELAGHYLKRERPNHTLQPTALANEVYLRLANADGITWQGKAQFMALAACQIRKILVDHARRRNTAKRGGGAIRMELDRLEHVAGDLPVDLPALDDALGELARRSTRQARVVELRFFAGMTIEEVAEVARVSPSTVKNEWDAARSWLAAEMAD